MRVCLLLRIIKIQKSSLKSQHEPQLGCVPWNRIYFVHIYVLLITCATVVVHGPNRVLLCSVLDKHSYRCCPGSKLKKINYLLLFMLCHASVVCNCTRLWLWHVIPQILFVCLKHFTVCMVIIVFSGAIQLIFGLKGDSASLKMLLLLMWKFPCMGLSYLRRDIGFSLCILGVSFICRTISAWLVLSKRSLCEL